MSLHLFSVAEKLAAMEIEIMESRGRNRAPGSANQRHHEILKAISSDLRARQQLPRNNALGALERELESMKRQKCHGVDFGYDMRSMARVTSVLISKWPVISQALEAFGEVSAE